jgi:hypothetical protein
VSYATVFYANVYRVDQLFGGPEEGGWWYDAGEFLELESEGPFIDREAAQLAAKRIKGKFCALMNEGTRPRWSAAGSADYEVTVESHQGRSYPTRKPHYE